MFKRIVGLVLIIILFFSVSTKAQTLAFKPSPFIYRIQAADCGYEPTERVLTGFRVKRLVGIVTALHGVIGCNTISAQPGSNGDTINNLIIGQVDIDRDVALLWSDKLFTTSTEGIDAIGPMPTDADYSGLQIIGYPSDVYRQRPIVDVRIVEVTELGDLLPRKRLQSFADRSSPSVSIKVLSVQAPLTIGHSGAPLINRTGKVVGVGNGGIDLGRTDMSWAIPWQDIQWKVVSQMVSQKISWKDFERLNQLAKSEIEELFAVKPPSTTIPPTRIPPTPIPATNTPVNVSCQIVVDPAFIEKWSADIGCPTQATKIVWTSFTPFQTGVMMWRDDTKLIYGFFDGKGWQSVPDQFRDGMPDMPDSNRGQPPSGLFHPIRGTGLIWATNETFFKNLGWARIQQKGFCANILEFTNGFIIRDSGLGSCVNSGGVTLSSRSSETDFEFRFIKAYYQPNQWFR